MTQLINTQKHINTKKAGKMASPMKLHQVTMLPALIVNKIPF